MTETTKFRVKDFECPMCVGNVELALQMAPAVDTVEIHFTSGEVEISYDPSSVDPASFEQIFKNHGYSLQSD